MCIVSMVIDNFGPKFPAAPAQPWPWQTQTGTFTLTDWQIITKAEIEGLRKLIAEFKEAVEHAKRLDVLLKQPDCVDPEKEKLVSRVAELEKKLADIAVVAQPSP